MRDQILAALKKHAEGQIALHQTNIEVYLNSVTGIGEHSDVLEAVQTELDKMAAANDRLEMLNKFDEPKPATF